MRTTLDLEEDVLLAAKELALLEHKTAGQVVSELARAGLRQARTGGSPLAPAKTRNGVPLLAGTSTGIVSAAVVRQLQEDDLLGID